MREFLQTKLSWMGLVKNNQEEGSIKQEVTNGGNINVNDQDEESVKLEVSNISQKDVTVDYIGFWKAIEESNTVGHEKIKKLIKDGQIQIGDSIPNIAFWKHMKDKTGGIDQVGNFEHENFEEQFDETTEKDGKRRWKLGCTPDLTAEGIHVQNETVFRIILDNVFNGHQLILDILDTFIKGNCSDCKNTEKDKIEVDLNPLFKRYKKSEQVAKKKMRLVQELIELQNDRGDDENIRKIFNHPVIKILILRKWESAKGCYSFSVKMFTLFVFIFTFFVRLRILEANDTETYVASVLNKDRNVTFNFSVQSSEFAKLNSLTNFSGHYIPPENCQNENFAVSELNLDQIGNFSDLVELIQECRKNKILDFMNFSFTAYDLNSVAQFTARILESDVSGKFTALITQLSEKSSAHKNTKDFSWRQMFNILKNKPQDLNVNIIVYAVLMGGWFLSQIVGAMKIYIEISNIEKMVRFSRIVRDNQFYIERTRKRKEQNMYRYIWNAFFLFFGNVFCLISGFCGGIFLEIILMTLFVSLSLLEIVQMFNYLIFKPNRNTCKGNGLSWVIGFFNKVFRARYWRDPENYLEMMFLASVPLSIFMPGWELTQPETDEKRNWEWKERAICRGFVAIGVFAGWIELIIKEGNVSYSGVGDFIKMFYTIIKTKLFSYLQVCFFLVTAFSLSFWIVMEGHVEDGFSKGFWFSQVLTTTMSTGEFNTGDFYESIKGNGTTKIFAMLFLVGLIFFCTITMINLLVAAIISDYNKMKDEVDEENMLFIAEYIIEFERILKNITFLENFFTTKKETGKDFVLTYCPHLICTNCTWEQLPVPRPGTFRYNPAVEANERNPLLHQILSIQEKRATQDSLCLDHKELEEKKLKKLSAEQIQLEEIERIFKKEFLKSRLLGIYKN